MTNSELRRLPKVFKPRIKEGVSYERAQFVYGLLIVLAGHLIYLLILWKHFDGFISRAFEGLLSVVGIWQFLYVTPAVLLARLIGKHSMVQGMVRTAVATFIVWVGFIIWMSIEMSKMKPFVEL